MPTLTPEQMRLRATHLRQESIRLRKSNPELSEQIGKGATALKKIAEHREKQSQQQDHRARSLNEIQDDATLYGRPNQTAGDASPAGVDSATQEQPGTVDDGAAGRGCTQEAGRAPREA